MWFIEDVRLGITLNVAVAEAFALKVMLHEPVPLHAPDHPANVEVELGEALSVTAVPLANVVLHVLPQLIPAGLLVIVPLPAPAPCTVTV